MITKKILTVVAIIVLTSILLKSFVDGNYGGDAWMYHLPFAARIWGMVPPDEYTFEYVIERRFEGFPLLPEFLQGFFWLIFQKAEATNLLCSLSLVIYLFFLKSYFQVPLYLSVLALLAVPMIHMHAASSYIDLPGNVAVTIMLLITYLLYTKEKENVLTKQNIIIFLIAAAVAANTKHALVPIVFLILCAAGGKAAAIYLRQDKEKKVYSWRLPSLLIATVLSALVIFATPVKNTLIYGNPFYPVEVKVAGLVLNHAESYYETGSAATKKIFRPQRWVYSLLEINAFDKRRPWPWSLAMDFVPLGDDTFGVGGYFSVYVVFNVLLFLYLCWRNWCRETKVAAILVAIMSAVTSVMPSSHELRYYMYWMMSLISLNAYLVCRIEKSPERSRIVNPQNLGLVATVVMVSFIVLTKHWYTIPEFTSFADQVKRPDLVHEDILKQINEGDSICLVGKTPQTFLYSSHFHPPLKYSLKAEFDDTKLCGSRKVIK